MPKFAANLTMMFTELEFLDRFEAAANAGFEAVEYLFPYTYDKAELAAKLKEYDLKQVLFNAPPGNWASGDRGLAAKPALVTEFQASVSHALDYAEALSCPRIHVMAGNAPVNTETTNCFVDNIGYAADLASERGVEILIEPINARQMPDYFLGCVNQAGDVLKRVNNPAAGLMFDFYHAQIIHGDVTVLMRSVIESIRHVQIASVPERHEPNVGELAYKYVLDELDRAGYQGWVGCEYTPAADTVGGLSWLSEYTKGESWNSLTNATN